MSNRIAALLAPLVLFVCTVDCRTPAGSKESARGSGSAATRHLERRLEVSADQLVTLAERLRDRSFERPPEFRIAEDLGDREPDGTTTPSRILASHLFGRKSLPLPARSLFADVARYVPSEHRVLVQNDIGSDRLLEVGTVAALVEGLEHRHFAPEPPSGPADRRVARLSGLRADDLLVAAALLFDRSVDATETPVARIARRPDVVRRLEPLAGRLRAGDPDGEKADELSLRTRLRAITHQDALTVGAALFRAGGWSAVELLYERPPQSTADVTNPARWMKGRGLGSWGWPSGDGSPPPVEGRTGPALLAAFLGSARHNLDGARPVRRSWRSDAFRATKLGSSGSNESSRGEFIWLQQWKTPTRARQLARLLEGRLERVHGNSHDGDVRWSVVRKGLSVGIALHRPDGSGSGAPETVPLGEIETRFRPRDPLPLDYEPSRRQTFRRKVQRATIEKGIWRDPASKLDVDVSAAQKWTFRSSRTLPLRWFAKRVDGAILQLSTELEDPFAPKFGTEAYRRELGERFTESLQSSEVRGATRLDEPVDSALKFTVVGERDGKAWKIGVWQFQYGDVVTTVSLQARADRYGNSVSTARKVYESITPREPPPGPRSEERDAGSGTIEYEIEESDR